MALIPSGMGWSADENYMMQSGNAAIAYENTIAGATILPYVATDADARLQGLFLGTQSTSTITRSVYVVSRTQNALCGICSVGTSGDFYGVSNVRNAEIRIVRFDPDNTINYALTVVLNQNSSAYPTYGTGLYSKASGFSRSNMTTYDPDIPYYANNAAAQAALGESKTYYYKVNSGYAVTGIVKYLNSNNETIVTPILISSDNTFTQFSGVVGYNEYNGSTLYDGVRFYYRFFDDMPGCTANGVLTMDITASGKLSPYSVFKRVAQISSITVTDSPNPYDPGGDNPSEPGGGDGDTDTETDIDFPVPPTIGAVSSGFVTLFLPTLSQINSLASYLWSISYDLEQVKKMFLSPMDAILGLYILPLSPSVSGSKAVSVAGVPISGFTWSYTTQEYISLSCGSVTIPKETGSYLDYSPMTKLQIWLPFIGFREIDADDCMGKTLTLQYNISVLSGACVAMLKCGDTLLYSWAGNCSMQIPITGADFRSVIGNSLSIAATVAGLAVGSPTTATAIKDVASIGQNALNTKPLISRSGSISGDVGFLAKQVPYIVRSNPVLCNPGEQNKYIGYPAFVTVSLGSLAGYNEVYSIHLEGVPGTDTELSEIESLLKSGVIF